MSWGYKITIVLVLFMGFISIMVYRMVSTKVDLVSDKYYENAIHFQDKIDQRKNGEIFNSQIELKFNEDQSILSFSYPDSILQDAKGTIYCYRASEIKADFEFKFVNNLPEISFDSKPKGFWRVSIDYKRKGKGYLIEKEVFID
jgi:FixH